MYLISTSKKGFNSLQLAEQLGITQKSALFLNHRIREMLKGNSKEKFSSMVEVDETYVGCKNKNRHHDKKIQNSQDCSSLDKSTVVGLLQRDGTIITFVVINTDADTLHTILGNNLSDNRS